MAVPDPPPLTISEAMQGCEFTTKRELAGLCRVDPSTVTTWGEFVSPAYVPIVLAFMYLKKSSEAPKPIEKSASPDRGVQFRGPSFDIGHETWLAMPANEKAEVYDRLAPASASSRIRAPGGNLARDELG